MAAVHQLILQSEIAAVHATLHAERAEAYPPRLRAAVEIGQVLPTSVYLRAQRLRHRMRAATLPLLADVVACPSRSSSPPRPGTRQRCWRPAAGASSGSSRCRRRSERVAGGGRRGS
jgi:hypothetical protein